MNRFLFLEFFVDKVLLITNQKNMKTFLSFSLTFFLSFSILAQSASMYISDNFLAAIETGTRTNNGEPGPNYWVNHADYSIDVTVDPETGMISGSATMVYYNDSPDTLNTVVLRLYQNIYKKGNSRQFSIGSEDLTDGMEISKLRIDNSEVDLSSSKVYYTATNMYVNLDEPLLSKTTITMDISWSFKMPQKRWIRFGQYSKKHLFVGYWYPQIAVYDDLAGWDRIEYAGMVEFYNDLNSFDVNITIPSDFVVWATGELQNAGEVFNPVIVKKYENAKVSDEVIRIITGEDYTNGSVTNPGKTNTWNFKAVRVPDFAFAASTGSKWDAVGLTVDPLTGRRVLISSVYPDSAVHYEDVAMIARNAVEYMSNELPGVPFPYPQATVFANGRKDGGMEFPMMANDGAPDNYADLQGLTFHEVFHNYFPFFMGTNERKYAFMDEGWARYLPMGFLEKYAPKDNYFQRSVAQYQSFAGSDNELPPMIPTYIFNDYQTQRMAAYTRPALAYHLLHQMLGDTKFKKAIKEYTSRWDGKHPMPYDFFNTFDDVAGEDLSWFWEPWFFQQGYPDLAILDLTDENKLTIEKKGLMPVPVELEIVYEDGTKDRISKDARIWANGFKVLEFPLVRSKKVKSIFLGNYLIPDSRPKDNTWLAE